MTEDTLPTNDVDEVLESGDDLAASALAAADDPVLPPPSMGMNKPTGQALADTLSALQAVIERNAMELDRLKDEMKELRDSLKNVFENDAELGEAEEKAQLATQIIKERKTKVMASPQVLQLKTKIGELNEQKKEVEEALNNHLLNLYQVTGVKTFDTSSGQQREFNVRASLKGKGKAE